MNRTSRTGPLILRKDGTVLPGAIVGARITWGLFVGGLDPPTAGKTWHPAHESRLNLGPRPSATDSTSVKSGRPILLKNDRSPAVNPLANGWPAPGGPPRIP